MDQLPKCGITNMNYHNTWTFSTIIGKSIGTMNGSNGTEGKKANSSQDACLNEGVMLRFIYFFLISAEVLILSLGARTVHHDATELPLPYHSPYTCFHFFLSLYTYI